MNDNDFITTVTVASLYTFISIQYFVHNFYNKYKNKQMVMLLFVVVPSSRRPAYSIWVQPTLDPYTEAFYNRPIALT